MKRQVHAAAGALGFAVILSFWLSTVVAELTASAATIALVKNAILWGMIVLIPALMITGASGMSLGAGRTGALLKRKRRRMLLIALNGVLVLAPSAFFLANRASAGVFDTWFYGVQGVELAAGALNLFLIGRNIRDGLRMSGRFRRKRAHA
ncbi:MAG: hypothetical protein AAGE85_03415 [Pseudomonadota bacterium]